MSKKAIKYLNILTKIFINNNFFFFLNKKFFLNLFNLNFYYFILKKKLFIFPRIKNKFTKENWCTYRTLIFNLFIGIIKKFSKKIILKGIEYKIIKKNEKLFFFIGYSHKKLIIIPKNISVKLINDKTILIRSTDKISLGIFCNKIIFLRKYNLYKDKGIKFFNERKKIKERKKK
ncbi:50S ribosomal protein L6 [Candidatus Vidania fulgoroideorum]